MALIDDINNLPTAVSDGIPGHLNNHQVIHAALKDHETRLGLKHVVGTGSPQGRITATIGTQYTDQAATNGAIRWIKASGTGTIGWVVEYGDTGWRDMTAGLSDMVESGTFRLRRVCGTLYFQAAWLKLRDVGSLELSLPQGFTPSGNIAIPLYSSTSAPTPASIFRVSFNGRITIYVLDDRYSANDAADAFTEDPWPTVLPGTPI